MIFVFTIGSLYPINRETGYSNVITRERHYCIKRQCLTGRLIYTGALILPGSVNLPAPETINAWPFVPKRGNTAIARTAREVIDAPNKPERVDGAPKCNAWPQSHQTLTLPRRHFSLTRERARDREALLQQRSRETILQKRNKPSLEREAMMLLIGKYCKFCIIGFLMCYAKLSKG